ASSTAERLFFCRRAAKWLKVLFTLHWSFLRDMQTLRSLSIMLFISVLPCLGQAGKATLFGEIDDPSGLPVARAQVNAEEQATHALFSTISDERGEYRLLGLLPGEYVLRVKAPGFKSYQQ